MGDTSGVLTLQCYLCKHFGSGGMGCKAFPGSIPPEILHLRFDHRHPWFEDGERAVSRAAILDDHFEPDPDLPDDTRLWAALQTVGGGTWGGCVYDTDAIVSALLGNRG